MNKHDIYNFLSKFDSSGFLQNINPTDSEVIFFENLSSLGYITYEIFTDEGGDKYAPCTLTKSGKDFINEEGIPK